MFVGEQELWMLTQGLVWGPPHDCQEVVVHGLPAEQHGSQRGMLHALGLFCLWLTAGVGWILCVFVRRVEIENE